MLHFLSSKLPGASSASAAKRLSSAANAAAPASQEVIVDAVSALPARRVAQIIDELHTIEGPGFEITRPFPTRELRMFDPWILFDAFGPKVVPPGHPSTIRRSTLGQHPHRGFEAITYIIEGGFQHYDSTGKAGLLMPGSVQLMTAGGGIVHGGAPTPEVEKHGGLTHGYQIWLALPASDRMAQARTLDFHAAETPAVTSEDGLVWARVLSSQAPVYGATSSVLPTRQPIVMVHYKVKPGGQVSYGPLPAGYNAMVHVSIGRGLFGPDLSSPAKADQSVFFERSQEDATINFSNPADSSETLDVLLLAGQPTDEEIVQYGPFVGGSMQDIHAAQVDFQAGLMGALKPDGSAHPPTIWAA